MPKTAASATVDTTKTTVSTTSRAARTSAGPRVLTSPTVLQIAASQWSVMDGDERNSYAALNAQLSNPMELGLGSKPSAFNTFVALSAANIAAGNSLVTTAMPYAPAQPLPGVQMTATFISGTLKIMLNPDGQYTDSIALKAAKPILASDTFNTSMLFKKIGFIAGLNGPVDIAALFNSRFRVPGTGYQIAIELMGVTAGGFHTAGIPVYAVVTDTPPAQAEAQPEPNTEASKLEMG